MFDRSEMNMFAETVTVTKIAADCLRSNPQILKSLRGALNLPANSQIINFFTDISKISLEAEVQDSTTNLDVLKGLVQNVQEESSGRAGLDDLLRGHEKSAVQAFIRGQLRELFQL